MSQSSTLELARASYREVSLYSPNRAPARVDLSDNTNLWGVPPAAARAIHSAATASITRYPPLYVEDVKKAIGGYLGGIPPEMIVTGCGSDDVLDSAIRAFAEPGDRIAVPDPSFAMIPIFARLNGVEPILIPLADKYEVDPEPFLESRAKIIYLCSPNNPTGTVVSRPVIERLIDEAPGVVIIDEAYAEFAAGNCLDLLKRSPKVLITRTLSKAFGMAGLRIGYALGDPALIAEVEKSRGPYKVNAIAERAAVAALTEDLSWVARHVQQAIENRERMVRVLRDMRLSPIPSEANFVLVPVPNAVAIDQALRERGIAVRPFTALRGVGDALRISVGPWVEVEECLSALEEVLG